jgi:hypothetical protein
VAKNFQIFGEEFSKKLASFSEKGDYCDRIFSYNNNNNNNNSFFILTRFCARKLLIKTDIKLVQDWYYYFRSYQAGIDTGCWYCLRLY